MIFISHRGNTDRIKKDLENTQRYIDLAISKGYEVEVDIWCIEKKLFLGHDNPETPVTLEWLEDRKNKLWIHTKNRSALEFFLSADPSFKFFWHTTEPFILTSNCLIWAHDYDSVENDSLCIVPLLSLEQVIEADVREWYAICTDFPDQCKEKWEAK